MKKILKNFFCPTVENSWKILDLSLSELQLASHLTSTSITQGKMKKYIHGTIDALSHIFLSCSCVLPLTPPTCIYLCMAFSHYMYCTIGHMKAEPWTPVIV